MQSRAGTLAVNPRSHSLESVVAWLELCLSFCVYLRTFLTAWLDASPFTVWRLSISRTWTWLLFCLEHKATFDRTVFLSYNWTVKLSAWLMCRAKFQNNFPRWILWFDFLVSRSNVSLIGNMSVAQRNMKQNHLERPRAGRTACPQTRCRGLTERCVLLSHGHTEETARGRLPQHEGYRFYRVSNCVSIMRCWRSFCFQISVCKKSKTWAFSSPPQKV